MSVASHNLFTTFRSSRLIPFLKNPNLSPSLYSQNLHFRTQSPKILFSFASKIQTFTLRAYQSDDTINPLSNGGFNVDDFLSVAELLCIVSSAVVVVSYAVNCAVASSKKSLLGVLGSGKAFGWGVVALVSGVVIGGWIRRRQWRRVCGEVVRDGRRESVNLVERVEKLEEDLRSSATIIRVLSRQLEKLGIRFRVTRKSLKEPIAQTAALAQKNSEATRALAMQEDLLEKELVEIQKVLLAMQEQQQKQLELILAISKSGKLRESRSGSNQEQDVIKKSGLTEGVKQLEIQETQSSGTSKGNNNDRP